MSGRPTNLKASNWMRWLKFNLVGAIGIAIQLAVLAFLHHGFAMNYLAATALAVEATIIHNFFWHAKFTWRDRKSHDRQIKGRFSRFLKFNASNGAVSLVGNLAVMKLLVGVAGFNYLVASLLSIAACSLVNFCIADRAIFVAKPARQTLSALES
jgi:putative flippase GtrA